MTMRTLCAALVALLATSGLATAGDPNNGGTSGPGSPPPPDCREGTPCSDPEFRECMRESDHTAADEERCKREYCERTENDWCMKWRCRDRPHAPGCPPPRPGQGRECLGRAERNPHAEECREFCMAHPDECKRFCEGHPGFRMCAIPPRGDARHVGFEPLPDGLLNLTVGGRLVLSSVRLAAEGPIEAEWTKHSLRVESDGDRLELHDDASGFLRFKGDDGAVTLVFPAGVQAQPMPGGSGKEVSDKAHAGFKVRYTDGGLAFLESRHATWVDDRTVSVTEFFSFHVAPGQGPQDRPGFADAERRDKYRRALEHGDRVGAEIRVHPGQDHEVLAYDEVDVRLRAPRDRPTPEDPLVVTLSAELPEGRAFVLHLNRSLLDVREDQLRLRYFDLPEGENSTARTEVVFAQARDLDDILDPTDDAGQPEYYVVRDAHGLQVIVTVPHWSVHMIELASLAEIVPPSVVVGVVAGAAGAAVAAVALFAPRRRREG